MDKMLKFYDLSAINACYHDEIMNAFNKVLDSGWFIMGSELKAFESEFAEFVKVMYAYPEGADCCEHVFRWVKAKIRKRPTFLLSHTIIQANDEFALITERVYYVSAQLNSLQITTAWLPYAKGGHFGLAMSASADILDSTMGRLLRPVGRNKAKELVTDVMRETKADLEALGATPE